jgi:hypothetical protein
VARWGMVARVVSEGEKKERDMAGMVATWPCLGLPRVALRGAVLH